MGNKKRIAIGLNRKIHGVRSGLLKTKELPGRNLEIRTSMSDKPKRTELGRLVRECSKLSRTQERSLADLGMAAEAREWPEY
jgi:hypothetical protein